jgi:hypothetical protein
MNIIVQNFIGGLGNQIFMVLNAISLSIDNNLDLYLNTCRFDFFRKDFTKYKLFDNIELRKKNILNIDEYIIIKQDGLKYNALTLKSNNNYLLNKDVSGYFQCWKFFWHNKIKIKNYFNFYNERFDELGNIIKNMGNTIGIHLRLTDYIGSNFYAKLDMFYYENILNMYDLEKYNIILFSDDTKEALKLLNNINCLKNKKIVIADAITIDDEEQFILLCYTNIRICANSSYSLTACYMTEIFEPIENRKYHFPNKWYNLTEKQFCIDELINTSDEHFVLNCIE